MCIRGGDSVDENGLTNEWHGILREEFENKALRKIRNLGIRKQISQKIEVFNNDQSRNIRYV